MDVRLVVLAVGVVLTAGCASVESLVRTRASHDFACAPEQVTLEARQGLHVARGCGQVQAYGVTGEWGSRWAVPCVEGADVAATPFTYASPELCRAVLGDAGVVGP